MKNSMIKRIAAAVLSTLAVTAMCGVSAFANPGDIEYGIKACTTAPTQDGVITVEEYAGNEPIVLDGSGKNTEAGGWVGDWGKEVIKYYFTWDAKNLYLGVTVEGDESASQDAPLDEDWFRNGDMIQIGFNPDFQLQDCHPIALGFGFTADAAPAVYGDAFRSTVDGEQTKAISGELKGFSKKYSPEGINYCMEVIIPWDNYILVNGVGRAGDGAPLYDFRDYTATEGLEIGLWLVYVNDLDGYGGTAGDVCLRTDMTTGGGWVAQEMSSLALVLENAPAAETEPETEAEVVDEVVAPAEEVVDVAPQTFDAAVIAAVAAIVSAAGYAISKKH